MEDRPQRQAIRVQKPIEVTYTANCPPIDARIEDISEKGCFLDTTHALTINSVIEFEFFLADETPEVPIKGRGRVVWTAPMLGVGIEFLDLTPEARERIRFFVAAVFFGQDESA